MAKFSVILVEPKYWGNIGSVARIMKNFGFSDLVLVNPPKNSKKDARMMASHAQDVLRDARIVKSFDEVVKSHDFLVATSAVIASDKNSLRMPVFPEELKNSLNLRGRIGLVFGREDYGLLNEELRKCDLLVTIPASREYPTLNLALSVGIVLYELSSLKRKIRKEKKKFRKANAVEKKVLLEKFGELVDSVYTHEPQKTLVKKTFRTILGRAFVSGREASSLIGIFRKAKERMK